TLELTEEARKMLAERGYDPLYGARPLKRTIQRELESPLGRMIIRGEVAEGRTVTVEARDGKLEFSVRTEKKPAKET
ncbi:MAG: hypothetical protein OEZ59_14285, partial [Deltaproteobacteria bacterium]|nr:hypothetical protein [Deltaproteobacteria bacterium]